MKNLKHTLITALLFGGSLVSTAQTARIQVIHNCADAAADSVDVYLNGTKIFDNFAFRNATAFTSVPAGVLLNVDIAPKNSTSVAQSIANFQYTLTANEKYVLVANGIVSPSGYSPAPPFDLDVFTPAKEDASMMSNTEVLVVHGSTDAPTVDVQVPGAGTVINDLPYGNFQGYLNLPTADYTLNVTDASGTTVVKSYQAPLATLNLQGEALVVVASGFLTPANNNNGPEFGLWVALPAGGPLVELPSSTANVQIIHNSADLAASTVDIWLNDELAIDNFTFRTATSWLDLPAEVTVQVGVAPANSTNASQSIATFPVSFSANETYVVTATGIVSTSGYTPAQSFDLQVYDMGRETATQPGNTDVLVLHGSTDAPTVDVVAVGAGTIVNDISYNEYAGYLELPTSDYTLNITDATGTTVVASYLAPLQTLSLQGQSIVVVASGFLNPANNSNGSPFGLWAATASGGALVQLPIVTSVNEMDPTSFQMFPNPANDLLQIRMEGNNGLVEIRDASGRLVRNEWITSGTLSVSDLNNGTYFVKFTNEKGMAFRSLVIAR